MWPLGSWAAEHKTKELQRSLDWWALHSARHCDTAGKLFSPLHVSYYILLFFFFSDNEMLLCPVLQHEYRINEQRNAALYMWLGKG